jgi:acyl-CoA reductase-like NAD-dependent aldehyde dehydrogenase
MPRSRRRWRPRARPCRPSRRRPTRPSKACWTNFAKPSPPAPPSLPTSRSRQPAFGDVGDKTRKNLFASRGVLAAMRGQPGTGLLGAPASGVREFAAPAGLVFGLIPVTNPAATAIFKALIAVKARNAVILSFPRRAAEVGERVGELFAGVLAAGGWPGGLVQVATRRTSRRRTEAFFQHPGVDLILATGGPSMVRAAYASGRPAIGVGAGNAPCLVCADADPVAAAAMIVESKSFDHGLICGAEHNLLVESAALPAFAAALAAAGAAVLDAAEGEAFRSTVLSDDGGAIRRRFIGRPAAALAAAAGISRRWPIRLLVVPAAAAECVASHALAREKMAPVLSLFEVADERAGIALAVRLLEFDGRGHTAAIHTADAERAERFALAVPASRIIHNSPATQGVIGLTTALVPSLTLGCGFFGGNSTGDNVTFHHLRNLKRLAGPRPPAP